MEQVEVQAEDQTLVQTEENTYEPPEGFTLVSRKSRKNPYTRKLKNTTAMICWYKSQQKPQDEKYQECKFNKFVMKLTPRDITKITQLMNFLKEDSYYDTIEKITSFNQQDYLERKNIKPDDEN